nr:hypothetical protein [Treponema sp.]
MKKIFLIFAAAVALSSVAWADDGGSYRPEDWTYGNIYVKEPNEKIALEKELMIVEQTASYRWDEKNEKSTFLHGSEVEAVFGFRNTAAERVVVPCAFPVVVKMPFTVRKDGSVTAHINYSAKPLIGLWEFVLNKRGVKKDERDGKEFLYDFIRYDRSLYAQKEEIFSLDKKLQTLSADEYLARVKMCGDLKTLQPCEIVQDGKKVSVQTVGVETSIEKDEEASKKYADSDDRGAEVYNLNLTLHFYHELTFAPSAASVLSVKYAIDSESRSYHGTSYELFYDISTGGTWKGDIKSFLVLTDSDMQAKNSKTGFEKTNLGEMCSSYRTYLYAAENYKPEKDEYFVFSTEYRDYEAGEMPLEERDVQDFVSGIRASSALSGSYKMAGEGNNDSALASSTYEAKTSFDGNILNGWVEGGAGDGIGEWIEFTLSKPALGPFATNGLRRFYGEERDDKDGWWYDEDEFSIFERAGGVRGTWEANNRVKSMTLTDGEGRKIAALEFSDKFPHLSAIPSDWIGQNAVRKPIFLPRGTYRMTIESVYKGKKWDDTVLGEVWFIPLGVRAARILAGDPLLCERLTKAVSVFAGE